MAELSEDIEVVTPGHLLQEGRRRAGLSQSDVAKSLKLRESVIVAIECNEFPHEQSPIFMRGYLRSYARLVNVDVEEVFSAYEQFDIAQQQYAEMQSFSQITQKKTHDNRLMLTSYVIGLIIIGLFVFWWWQTDNQKHDISSLQRSTPSEAAVQSVAAENQASTNLAERVEDASSDNAEEGPESADNGVDSADESKLEAEKISSPSDIENLNSASASADGTANSSDLTSQDNTPATAANDAELVMLTMTFSEDCWVNVVDGTGERIAYGIKTAGRVMPLQGVPPFEITLGTKDAVSIIYQDKPIDMSVYPSRGVARFRLPPNNG